MSLLTSGSYGGLLANQMNTIHKEDLIYKDYSWRATPGDNPAVRGKPDSTLLNRTEGYEVLTFLNSIARRYGWTKTDCLKAERKLHNHFFQTPRTRAEWESWLLSEKAISLFW